MNKLFKPFFLTVLSLILSLWTTVFPALPVSLGQYSSTTQPEILTLDLESLEIEPKTTIQVSVGYGVSNISLISGSTGSILVDAADSPTSAQRVIPQFKANWATTHSEPLPPLQAIIYTHSHPDHTGGAQVFVEQFNSPSDPALTIYARANFAKTLDRAETLEPIADLRRDWEHAFGLGAEQRAVYFGDAVPPPRDIGAGTVAPMQTFGGDRLALTIGGVDLELVAATGESADELFVWLPQERVLFCGDNYYAAFPNLAAIRGTPYRDVAQWVQSLDGMLARQPIYLVPGHSAPLAGGADIQTVLGNYRGAIEFVLTETLAGMNRGLTPDELVEKVRLPSDLADLPYLQPVYGNVPWSVRSIFSGYLGWFDGNPTHLNDLSPLSHAQHLAQLAGGIPALWSQTEVALAAADYQWVLELTDALLRLLGQGPIGGLDQTAVKTARITALEALAAVEVNTNAANYYRSAAQALKDSDLEFDP